MTRLQKFVLFGGLSILLFKLSNIYWTFYVPAIVSGTYSWYQFFLALGFGKSKVDPVDMIRLQLFREEYHEALKDAQDIIRRTMEQFKPDPGSAMSLHKQFHILERNMIMRLRHAEMPEDLILRWTLWDGRVVEYKLKEDVI